MEKIIPIVLFSVCAVFIILFIKKYAPEYALLASVCAGCMILFFVFSDIGGILDKIMGISGEWSGSIIKVGAISFIGQWGISLCRDAGENSIAEKMETAVKILILIVCIPYIDQLFTLAAELN